MSTRLQGNHWIADIRDKTGKRYRPQFSTRQEAALWEAQAKLALSQGKPLPPTATQIRHSPHKTALDTLKGVFDYVVQTDWGNARASQTLIKNGKDVVEFFKEKTNPQAISIREISQFKNWLANRGAKPSTINRKLSALSKLLKTVYELGTLDRMPIIKWEREEKTKFRYLDEREQGRLFAYWRGKQRPDMVLFCEFLLETGARLSEALTVRRCDIEVQNKVVTFWRTKTDKPRTVPLSQSLFAALQKRHGDSLGRDQNKLFNFPNAHRLRQDWQRMQRDLGWPEVGFHTLRHTCCTNLIQKGIDIKSVMEWLGHSNLNTTNRYMQISPQGLMQVRDLLENFTPLQQEAA